MYSAKWRIRKDVMQGKQCLNKRSAKLITNVFFLKCFLRLNGIPESKCNPKVRQNSGGGGGGGDSETKNILLIDWCVFGMYILCVY